MLLGSSMLEVAVGMAFFYLLLAIICSSINELIARFLKLRASTLQSGISELLADPTATGIANELYQHPLIKSLEKGSRLPSYIHSRTFAAALVDSIAQGVTTVAALKTSLASNDQIPADLKRQLTIIINDANDDMAEVRRGVAVWFDDSMARVSGWYKRKAQVATFVVASLIAIFINADSLKLANGMLQNPAAREAFIAQASAIAPTDNGGVPATSLKAVKDAIQPLGIELGWPDVDLSSVEAVARYAANPANWLGNVPGWLITVFAILMGAPFWFDLVSRVANIRSSGTPPPSTTPARVGGP